MFGFGYNANFFYPEDLLNEYWNIPVNGVGATVSVRKYRCANPKNGGTADAESIKNAFIGASGSSIIRESGGAVPYVDAFTGKGSPAGIGSVLAGVNKYRDAFIKQYKADKGHPGDCAALFAQYRADQAEEMLQAFCDKYIGLDCNGFVGNFAKRMKSGLGPQNSPKQYHDHRTASRTRMDDIVNLDVIVWATFSHIAIIDSFADLATVKIVQSTGGGPQMTAHHLVPAGNKLFKIMPPTLVGGMVYVISNGF